MINKRCKMDNSYIRIRNVKKYFKTGKALDDVSMDFEKGKISGIVGRNGSGKTVLLKLICGLMKVTDGSIEIEGKRIGKDIEIPESVGVIIETPGFIKEYSGLANLKFLAGLSGKYSISELEKVMKEVGLDPKLKKKVAQYSLGMRQKLGIAQAIMENPNILILDEPTNGLDKKSVDEFRKLMLTYKEKGKTILLASHSAEDIQILCDIVYELDEGKLVDSDIVCNTDVMIDQIK